MPALFVDVPYPVFFDQDGQPLDNGSIYVGTANLNPITSPITVYYDEALTITASQPLRTINGYIYRNGTPAQIYVNAAGFSITVLDRTGSQVFTFPNETAGTVSFATLAAQATALQTARTFTIGATARSFDGTANVAWTLANIGAAASGANTDITALDQDVAVTATGTIASTTIGYRGIPQNAKTGAYTLVLADAGKHISNTTGGFAIPSNGAPNNVLFPIGTAVVVFNDSASSQNITITTDTLRLAGTATTGTRALAQYGIATLVKVAATVWVASGAGLT